MLAEQGQIKKKNKPKEVKEKIVWKPFLLPRK